jgi:acetylornithine deacetylase/succinyl-diaminopimelate desuccinylase-like protein
MTDTEKLLCELIALPSVNPAFLPAHDRRAGEGPVADFLAATAAQAGLDVDLQCALPGRANVIATLRPTGKATQRVLLAPHLDTVPGISDAQYVPRLTRSRICGRGACDTKGSVAAMLAALLQAAGHGPRPAETEIVFAGLVDEEHGQAGARALAASGLKADLAIVGEPTRLKIVTAHKGSLWLCLETRGKAAHGSRPELGRNAVHEMARVVCLLETVYAERLRRRRHPILGHATVNVGAIAGGTQPNIVPDACRIRVDRRTLPGETGRSVRAKLLWLFRAHQLRVKVAEEKPSACLPMETDARLPLVRRFFLAAGQKKEAGVDYFCDASVLAAGGIPSVVFGPGDIAQAHTADEWIARGSLESATRLLARSLRSLP